MSKLTELNFQKANRPLNGSNIDPRTKYLQNLPLGFDSSTVSPIHGPETERSQNQTSTDRRYRQPHCQKQLRGFVDLCLHSIFLQVDFYLQQI